MITEINTTLMKINNYFLTINHNLYINHIYSINFL